MNAISLFMSIGGKRETNQYNKIYTNIYLFIFFRAQGIQFMNIICVYDQKTSIINRFAIKKKMIACREDINQ